MIQSRDGTSIWGEQHGIQLSTLILSDIAERSNVSFSRLCLNCTLLKGVNTASGRAATALLREERFVVSLPDTHFEKSETSNGSFAREIPTENFTRRLDSVAQLHSRTHRSRKFRPSVVQGDYLRCKTQIRSHSFLKSSPVMVGYGGCGLPRLVEPNHLIQLKFTLKDYVRYWWKHILFQSLG